MIVKALEGDVKGLLIFVTFFQKDVCMVIGYIRGIFAEHSRRCYEGNVKNGIWYRHVDYDISLNERWKFKPEN